MTLLAFRSALGMNGSAPSYTTHTVKWPGGAATATQPPGDADLTAGSITVTNMPAVIYNLSQYTPNDVWSVTHTSAQTTLAAAVTAGAYQSITLSRTAGLIPSVLRIKAARGAASSPRGFAIRSSVDGYTADLVSISDIPTVRPPTGTLTQFGDYDISALGSQTSITFRIYHFSPTATGAVDFDDLEVDYLVASAATNTGIAAGSWTYAGTAVGKRAPVGTATGSWTYAGAAVGKRAPQAVATGSWTYAGTAVGTRAPRATADGSWTYAGTAVGSNGSIPPVAVTYVGGGTSSTANNASVTPVLPAGILAGDLLVVVGIVRSPTATMTPPAGWSTTQYATNSTAPRIYLTSKTYVEGDTAPLMTLGNGVANNSVIGRVLAFRNAQPPVLGTAYSSGATTGTTVGPVPGVAHADGGMAILVGGIASTSTATPTTPTGWSGMGGTSTGNGDDAAMYLARDDLDPGVASSDVTYTSNATVATTSVGVQFALPVAAAALPVGTAAGAFTYAGTAVGARAPRGTAAGAFTYVGAAIGKRTPRGTASGAFTYAGAAIGTRSPRGAAAGAWTYVGAAVGKRTPKAVASGSFAYVGAAVGVRAPRGVATGAFTYSGVAVGGQPLAPVTNLLTGDSVTFTTSVGIWSRASNSTAYTQTWEATDGGVLRYDVTGPASTLGSASHATADAKVAVTPGEQLYLRGRHRQAAGTLRSVRLEAQFYDGANALLTAPSSGLVTASGMPVTATARWQTLAGSVTVPTGAATMRLRFIVLAATAGEIHYWDEAYVGRVALSGPRSVLSQWKLHLPTGSAGNIDEVESAALVAGYESAWFMPTADGLGFRFVTPVDGVTTSGSTFPRDELREVDSGGAIAGWTPADNVTRTWQGIYRVNHLPAGDRETTMFQLHNGDTEVTTIRTTETAGGIRLAARKNGITLTPYFETDYQYGTDIPIKIEINTRVKISYNGTLVHDYPFSDLDVGPGGVFYLKAGNYLQVNSTTADPTEWGEVEIRPAAGTTSFLTRTGGAPQGSAVGSWSYTGTAIGKRAPKATATGSWSYAGTAMGKRVSIAAATGAFTYAGAAVGKRQPKATATGATAWSGTAIGRTDRRGTAVGTFAFVGTAVGKRIPKATAAGTFAFVGAAVGRRLPRGVATGTLTYVGVAVGTAPGSDTYHPTDYATATLTINPGTAVLASNGVGTAVLAGNGASTAALATNGVSTAILTASN